MMPLPLEQSNIVSVTKPDNGEVEWPAPSRQLKAARSFLKECAHSGKPVLFLPDKDADGLCATRILYRTLFFLNSNLDPSLVHVHFVAKGSNVHEPKERAAMSSYHPNWVICVDQGSRPGPPLVESSPHSSVRTLVVDHHWSEEFPRDTEVLSAAKSPPIATSSLLAYVLCSSLHPSVLVELDFLCVIGTMGDLGTSLKWDSIVPSSFESDLGLGATIRQQMKVCEKKYGKKKLSDIVSLLNAPRRTAAYDPISSWNALSQSASPLDILSPSSSTSIRRLHDARKEVRLEIERCSRGPGTGPKWSGDGKVAMVRIHSAASIHPVIATRWANTLKSSKLKIVMCANDGYLMGRDFEGESMTNFSCRIAKSALEREEVNIIAMLTEYASRVPGLRDSMGDNFARGHKEASGGIVKTRDFEKLWRVMVDSEEGEISPLLPVMFCTLIPLRKDVPESKSPSKRPRLKSESVQHNTLDGWVKKSRHRH